MSRSPATSKRGTDADLATVSRPINEVVPYWRNPRRITDEAVNAVATSIQRYGYQQPVVVDDKNVIIIGHTRYAAMRKLGWDSLQVVVADDLTEDQAKALRVLDNKTAELTEWDFDKLADELVALDADTMLGFFPEVSSINDPGAPDDLGQDDEPPTQEWDEVDPQVEFVCPECFHSWEMTVNPEDVLSGKPLEAK